MLKRGDRWAASRCFAAVCMLAAALMVPATAFALEDDSGQTPPATESPLASGSADDAQQPGDQALDAKVAAPDEALFPEGAPAGSELGVRADGGEQAPAAPRFKRPLKEGDLSDTVSWMLDAEGCLHIYPEDGVSGSFELTGNAPWYVHPSVAKEQDKIKSVVVEGDVKAEGSLRGLFSGCRWMTSCDIANLDTSAVTDMTNMFVDCGSLTHLDLSHFDTKNVTTMYSMFAWCESLTELDLSSFNTENVTSMSTMFAYCSSLTELDVSSFDTSKLRSLNSAFCWCSSLETLILPRIDGATLANTASLVSGCSSLKTIDLSGINTENVTSMSRMFNECSSLSKLDLSSLDTGNVKDMSEMFGNCTGLVDLDLSSFVTQNVTNMESMFSSCTALEKVTMVDSFSMDNVNRMSWMFYDCPKLAAIPAQISIPEQAKADADSVFALEGFAPDDDSWEFSSRSIDAGPLPTAYPGVDEGVICYQWAKDGRALDIGTIMGGSVRESITLNGEDLAAGSEVAVGDKLGAAVRPAALADLSLDSISPRWQRASSEGSPYADVAGAQAWEYSPVEADQGFALRVVVEGSGNYTGSIASDPVKVKSPATPLPSPPSPESPSSSGKSLAATGDAAGSFAAFVFLCAFAALVSSLVSMRAIRRTR